MSRTGWRVRAAMLARSFVVQASWNYRTLLGTGFAFAMLPLLRKLYGDDTERLRAAIERHRQLFNSHPYMTPMALGAVGALELEGEDPAIIERFKMALRGSLGTLGDRLVWAGWRPVCLLLALALLLAGVSPALAIVLFLVAYNAGHLGLRIWSARLGWGEGKRVGERLRRSRTGDVQRGLGAAGAFLIGLLIPLAAAGALVGTAPPPLWTGLAAAGAVLALRYGALIRTPAVLALAGVTAFGLVLGLVE